MSRKKYSIHWEDDEPVSFEVNGEEYERLEDVPDEIDREKLTAMIDASLKQEFEQELQDFDKEFQKDWEEHKKAGIQAEKIILGVFTGVAVLMLLIAFLSSASAILKMSREDSAPARVVEIIERREYVNEQDRIVEHYYFPVVEFTAADGRLRTVPMSEGSSVPQHEVGDEVTVLYNPDRPLEARIQSFGSSALMWVLPGITGILGLAFFLGVAAVRRLMPVREEAQNGLA